MTGIYSENPDISDWVGLGIRRAFFLFFSITTLDHEGQRFIANVVDSWRKLWKSELHGSLKVFIWEIAVWDLACQREICKVMCPRGPIFWMHPFVIKRENSKRRLLLKINGLVLTWVSTWMLSFKSAKSVQNKKNQFFFQKNQFFFFPKKNEGK